MSTRSRTHYGSWRQRARSINSNGELLSQHEVIGPYDWTETVISDDASNRDWRAIIAMGANATTNMEGIGKLDVQFEDGFVRYKAHFPSDPSADYTVETRGVLAPLSPSSVRIWNLTDEDLATAKNRALVRLYSNLAGVEATFKGMVFAGELKETLSMIKRPARALRDGVDDYFSSLKKRVPRRASRSSKRKIVASTWLEYAFGWKPLVSDIDSAIEQFYNSKLTGPLFEMVRGQGNVKVHVRTSFGATGTYVGVPLSANIFRTDDVIVKLYGTYSSNGRGCANLHTAGWNPVEFVPTLWELVPYSFLVDYFTNIGDIISSWSYRFLGLNFLSQTTVKESVATAIDQHIVRFPESEATTYTYTEAPGSSRIRGMNFIRVPDVGLTIPSLEISVPGLTSTKWLNMAALGVNLASTRKHINP